MKAWAGYGGLAVVAYIVCLALTLPASLLLSELGKRLPGLDLYAQASSGTVRAGSASQLRFSGRQLAELRWRWQASALLRGRLAYRLWLLEPEAATDVTLLAQLSWDRTIRLNDLQGGLRLPRALELAGVPPPPLNGRLRLALSELRSVAMRPQSAVGQVYLDDLHTAFGKTLKLGDFELNLSTPGEQIEGQVRGVGGALALDGELSLTPAGRYALDARVGVNDGAAIEVQQVLMLLGQPDSDGRRRLQVSGQLNL